MVEIQEENILPTPSLGHADKSQNQYVYGIGKVGDSVKLLLDPEKLIKDEDLEAIAQIGENTQEEGEEES